MAGNLFLSACGKKGDDVAESKKLVSYDTIRLDGESLDESYLKISSTEEGASAVAVTNGGHLTLHDATILKTGEETSGSPTFGRSGTAADSYLPDTGNPQGERPPVPGAAGLPETDVPDGTLTGGLMPEGVLPTNTDPGPGASHSGVYAGTSGRIELFNVSIETATGEGQGIYASGEGSSVTLVNGTITTDGSTAHGVLVTHKGFVSVENVTIITKGEHSSAIATYRGGGAIAARGGTYTAFGNYSAGMYSAGDIFATDVICKSISDNAAVVEGGSRMLLKNSVLWSRKKGAVMIYQSFSSDAPVGTAEFDMTGGSITSEEGPLFYITNTTGRIVLKHVELYSTSGILLEALKGDWGVDLTWAKPTQGGAVTLVAEGQTLPGDMVVDDDGSITAVLTDGTRLTGAINAENRGKQVTLSLDATSEWHVTADSYLTGLTFSDGVPAAGITNIIGNGHSVYYHRAGAPALGGKMYDLPGGGRLAPL